MFRWILRKLGIGTENGTEERATGPSMTLRDPEVFGRGGVTTAGVVISEHTALQYPPIWRAVNLLAKDVAKLDLLVWRLTGDGKQPATSDPSFTLLQRQANPTLNAYNFRVTLTARALLLGNGYAWILRDRLGNPTELIPLSPYTAPRWVDDELWYDTTIGDGRPDTRILTLPARDVIHIKGMGNGTTGLSMIAFAREALGLGLAAQTYGASFFGNSARPSVVITHPGELGKAGRDNIRKSWREEYGGPQNSNRTAVLDEGMSVSPFSVTNEDAQFLETREFSVKDVALFTGIPPHLLGDSSRVAYNSLEQESKAYLNQGLEPWLSAWEAELYDKLISERAKERREKDIKFVRRELIHTDIGSRGEFYQKMLTNGVMSVDEVRHLEDLNPLPNQTGTVHFYPGNLNPFDPSGGPEIAPEPEEPQNTGEGENGEEETEEEPSRGLEFAGPILSSILGRWKSAFREYARQRLSKPTDKYLVWVRSDLRKKFRGDVVESVAVPCELWGIDSQELTDGFFDEIEAELERIAEEENGQRALDRLGPPNLEGYLHVREGNQTPAGVR